MRPPTETRSKIGGWPLAAGITIVLIFLFFIRHILLPFILAALVAFVLTPVVDKLHHWSRLPRSLVAVGIYICVLGLLAGLAFFAGTLIVRDVSDVTRQFPQTLHSLVVQLAEMAKRATGASLDTNAVTNDILGQMRALLATGVALSIISHGMAAIFGIILALVLLVYFLASGKAIAAGVFWLVPPEYRNEVKSVSAKILPLLRRYFAGLFFVVLYAFSIAWIGFGPALHLQHAPLLAGVVGVLELIPIIGPAVAIGIIGITAIQQTSMFAIAGLAVLALGLRLSTDQIIGPLVLGTVVRVHPVVIIFAFLSGAILFGIIGLVLAVPVAASIKIVLMTYYSEPLTDNGATATSSRPSSLRR